MNKACAILTVYLLCCFPATAQPEQYRFKTWDQQKGLPANNCLSAMQDHNGYIWVCTVNGVSRFNGTNFREVAHYDSSFSIEGEVRRIIQDDEGVYWLASYEKGLIKVDFSRPKEKQIQAFNPLTLSSRDCPPFHSVNRLLDDRRGHIWVGTESNGLYVFDKMAKTFSRWKIASPYSLYSNYIRCLYLSGDGTIWAGIINGLVSINPVTGKTLYPKTSYKGVKYSYPPTVRGICYWNKDTFAVATDRGAHFYLLRSQTFVPVFPLNERAAYRLQEYHDVIKYSDEELWFATLDRGIWHANVRRKNYYYSWERNTSEEAIGKYPVFHFFRDKQDNVWVSHSKGLSYLNQQNARFKNFPFSFRVNQPPTKNFMVDGPKGITILRFDSLFIWNSTADYPKAIQLENNQRGVLGEHLWRHNRLGYISVNGNGIFCSDTGKHQVVFLIPKRDFPKSFNPVNSITQLLVDTFNNHEQWWVSHDKGSMIYRYDWAKKGFDSVEIIQSDKSRSIKSNLQFSQMLKDHHGGLWISTRNEGLFYMPDRNKNNVLHFSSDQSKECWLPGNYIEDIKLDNRDQLWATIRGVGLVKIEWQASKRLTATVYGKESGLTYMNLSQIQVDDSNNLWIGSPNGLYRFDQRRKWFNYYGQPNGIRNPVLTFGSTKDDAGNMYFASTDYLLRFHPRDFMDEKPDVSMHLLSVTVNDKIVDISNKSELDLKADENTLKFEFDVLDYDHPTGHYVLYKLENYDRDWILLQDVFQHTYNSLPSGRYIFRLKKVNADGSHDEATSLPVTIAAHFYNTWWFRVLIILLVISLTHTGIQMYIHRKLQKQRILLEKKQAVELERLRISSELHDDVGGELSAIRLLSEMAQTGLAQNAREQLSKISASSADLTQKINEIVWALNVKNDTLQSLVLYTSRYAVRFLDDIGIRCELTQSEEIPLYEVDGITRRNVFLLVKETLHNIVKHAGASCVKIDVTITEQLEISIHDNGKGIDQLKRNSSGNGLSTMEKRAADVHGVVQVLHQNGTLVKFEMPLK